MKIKNNINYGAKQKLQLYHAITILFLVHLIFFGICAQAENFEVLMHDKHIERYEEHKRPKQESHDAERSLFDVLFGNNDLVPESDETHVIYEPEQIGSFYHTVALNVLDKVHGITEQASLRLHNTQAVKNLSIKALACWRPKEEGLFSEARALLEVQEMDGQNNILNRFYGWVFANTPSLTHMKSSKYNISLVNCVDEIKSENIEKEQ